LAGLFFFQEDRMENKIKYLSKQVETCNQKSRKYLAKKEFALALFYLSAGVGFLNKLNKLIQG
jgi:hypothetical protein